MDIALCERARLARIKQNDDPSGLDRIGNPVLETVLARSRGSSAPPILFRPVVLREQIEAAVFRTAVRPGEQDECVARMISTEIYLLQTRRGCLLVERGPNNHLSIEP